MMTSVGPVRVRNLVAALGSPEAIFTASETELMRADGVGTEVASQIVQQRGAVDPAAEVANTAKLGGRIIAFCDADYPETLKAIYDPPLVLYVRGGIESRDRHAVAVVGTRSPTHYGSGVADRLAYQLAKVGFCVISGLARGIDTSAHRGALKGGGRTIAVLGGALDRLYPAENEELAETIAGQGALVTEYPLGREPDRTTFPYRNRVVSGLSMGIIVVEANVKSGAMITANEALEQGKSVFAVPGRIDTPQARGTHQLIKNGARLIEDVDDVVDEFQFLIPREKKEKAAALPARPNVTLTSDEQTIVRALWRGGLDIDSLTREVSLKIAQVNALLMGLEMKKVVRILPGRLVELQEGLRQE
ncbi:MAG TPA: DNA-processing protein DprA [Kiritimatiellia bacterium]|jgi:DNA processing protein